MSQTILNKIQDVENDLNKQVTENFRKASTERNENFQKTEKLMAYAINKITESRKKNEELFEKARQD